MTTALRAHFDGKVIVPDEPIELPIGEPLEITLRPADDAEQPLPLEERLRRLDAAAGRISAPAPSAESLRRENLYEERL